MVELSSILKTLITLLLKNWSGWLLLPFIKFRREYKYDIWNEPVKELFFLYRGTLKNEGNEGNEQNEWGKWRETSFSFFLCYTISQKQNSLQRNKETIEESKIDLSSGLPTDKKRKWWFEVFDSIK